MPSDEASKGHGLPLTDAAAEKMPGHWLLARLGKRVLRPGGLALTRGLLESLDVGTDDTVVEFAVGLGGTARMILDRSPHRYIGVDRSATATEWSRHHLPNRSNVSFVAGKAEDTQLPAGCASVVVGEAMLSMQTPTQKRHILAEAFRLLRPGGRYGIHELNLVPDDLETEVRDEICTALSSVVHVGVRPLTTSDWCELLRETGFQIRQVGHAPMGLLRPGRLIRDEGLLPALRFVKNVLTDAPARRRVLAMRRAFSRYQDHIGAVFVVAQKDGA